MGKVEFYRHALMSEDVEALVEVLNSVFLTTGPRTAEFEQAFARWLGVDHAVGLSSCTAALFLSLQALDVGPGDEVITTPMTFMATSNAILHCGATPVFVDVEPETGNIDVRRIERAITPKTRAIIPVHLYGTMVDMRCLMELANRHQVPVIEDAAHAVEPVRDGVRPGQLGRTACFSFYATKNLTCGEGGAIVTNDAELAERVRRLRSHGMSKGAADRYTGRYQHWDMLELGYKANLTDLQSVLLLRQLPRLEHQLARRESVAQRYEAAFRDIEGIDYPRVPAGARGARHLFTMWVPPDRRDETLAALQDRGVGVAVNYRAVHLLSYYRSRFGYERGAFPNAELIGDRTVTLPLYPGLSDEAVQTVIDTVRTVAATWS